MSRASTTMLRALHAAGRRRGLSHEDLRAAAGVTSLTLLDAGAADALLSRLNDGHYGGGRGRKRDAQNRTPSGVLRRASARQRAYLRRLIDRTGWTDRAIADFLAANDIHGGAGAVESGDFTTRAASRCITQLERAASNPREQRRRAAQEDTR